MNKKILWIGGGVVLFGLVVWMASSIALETPPDPTIGFGTVTIEGDALLAVQDVNQGDPAVGFAAPSVSGADWNGVPISITADGRPKVVIFLAHWCPHCQAEVPDIQAWLDAGNAPDDVDLYAVTILSDPLRPEWPPQEWLESEGWSVQTIMDDEAQSVARVYGALGTPFYLVLDGSNTNLLRRSGRQGVAALESMIEIARASMAG